MFFKTHLSVVKNACKLNDTKVNKLIGEHIAVLWEKCAWKLPPKALKKLWYDYTLKKLRNFSLYISKQKFVKLTVFWQANHKVFMHVDFTNHFQRK